MFTYSMQESGFYFYYSCTI